MNNYAITASVFGGIIVVCSVIFFFIYKRSFFPYPSVKNGSLGIRQVSSDVISEPFGLLIMFSFLGFFVLLLVYVFRR